MTSAAVAALVAVVALGFVEGLRRFYPARETWWRLRRARGRAAVRAMRERYEVAAKRPTPRLLSVVLMAMVGVWLVAGSLLRNPWYEIVLGVLPYAIVGAALLRLPGALDEVARRMKGYEDEAGDKPDIDPRGDDGGPTEIAL